MALKDKNAVTEELESGKVESDAGFPSAGEIETSTGGDEGSETPDISPEDFGISSDNGNYEENGISSALRIKSSIALKQKEIEIEDIILSGFKKVSRESTVIGLTGVVGEWGVVTPVHVLLLEDEDSYQLLDGLRRIFGAMRNGQKKIKAIVWDFSDKEEGKQMANVISLMINRSQHYRPNEMWEQMQILEEVNGLTPGLIEFLLQMGAGDAMKLKDIMLCDYDYIEIKEALLTGELTIDGAYKKLTNARKKENRLAKEDGMIIDGEDGAPSVDTVSDNQNMSVEEVSDLLELSAMDVGDSSLDDLNRASEARGEEEPYVQDVNDRHPLDADLKKAVMVRDKFSCQCCGIGGEAWLSVLVVHHIIQVSQGGPDSLENLVTLCQNCHITLHNYAWGKIYVDLESLDDAGKETFKNIFKYGNVIIEADKRLNRSRDKAMKEDKDSVRHMRPLEGLADNQAAFASAKN